MCCSSVVLHINMPCTCRWWCQEGKAQTEDAFDHYTEKENLDISKLQANLRLISWRPMNTCANSSNMNTVLTGKKYTGSDVRSICTQGISPQYFNNTVWGQRSLEAWVHFSCTTLLKVSALNTHNLLSCFITFLQIVTVLRHCVMLLTDTSIFSNNQFCILEYRFAIRTLNCSNFSGNATIYSHKCHF